MLISGPTEWAEVTLAPKAGKTNLLQHAYHPTLRMAAMPQAGSVAITRYGSGAEVGESQQSFFDEVMEHPLDHVKLHEKHEDTTDSKTANAFHSVAWSSGEARRNLLAIGSDDHVEIWEVANETHIRASLVKSISTLQHVRGIVWNPVADLLLSYSDRDLVLVDVHTPPRCIFSLPAERRQVWKSCSWSPNGLSLTAVSSSTVYNLSWSSKDAVETFAEPKVDLFQVDQAQKVAGESSKFGVIAAAARVSPRMCVLATDTPLVFQNASPSAALLSASSSSVSIQEVSNNNTNNNSLLRIRDPKPSSRSSLLIETISSSSSSSKSTIPSDSILDLTALRVTASSSMMSSLQVLNRLQEQSPEQASSQPRPTSHVLVLTRQTSGEEEVKGWQLVTSLVVPNLPTPDMLVVQNMRVIVGSTLTNRIMVAHMSKSESGWDASVTGELELPSKHVCRGLFLGERSPFLQAASAEKVKKSVFFHATAPGPQQIQLSKFKVPRRPQPVRTLIASESPVDAATLSESTEKKKNTLDRNADNTTKSAAPRTEKEQHQQSSDVLLATIVAKLDAMQTQLNARFDGMQTQLEQLTSRMARLESSSRLQ